MSPRSPRAKPLILVIDDDPDRRAALAEALKSAGDDVLLAANGAEGVRSFQDAGPDLVVLAEVMPELDGYQVCEALRSLPDGWNSPILMLMTSEDPAATRRALDAGATDFASIPIDPVQLARHVPFLLRMVSAFRDAVTGLPSQALFCERLASALAHSDRRGRKVATMALDLRNFRQLNDSLGRSAGDGMLTEVAKRVRHIVRLQDEVSRAVYSGGSSTVTRWGGDEFLLAVVDLSSGREAAGVAGRILEALQIPVQHAGRPYHLSGSIGISLFPDDSRDPAELLHFAAMALNSAKDSGRNNFAFFSPAMNDQARARFGLETDLHRAMEKEEITVHYQPIVHAGSGRIVGAEALARWTHPRIGPVGPDRFIPAAERLGLIDDLSRQLIRATSEHVRAWREQGLPKLYVSINISGRQFRDPNLAKSLITAVKRAGVGPEDFLLEVTESVLIDNLAEGERTLGRLKGLGFRIAIDDFGTGYSSLSYLRRFPIDVLKIEREFVRDVIDTERDRVMAMGIIFLAHGLGMEAVAEGVETVGQRDVLLACGCNLMQGYLFAKAMPADELAALMARTGGILVDVDQDAGQPADAGPVDPSVAAARYRALGEERRRSIRPTLRRSA